MLRGGLERGWEGARSSGQRLEDIGGGLRCDALDPQVTAQSRVGGASVRPEREGVEDWRRGTFGSGLSYFQQNFGTKLRHGSGVS